MARLHLPRRLGGPQRTAAKDAAELGRAACRPSVSDRHLADTARRQAGVRVRWEYGRGAGLGDLLDLAERLRGDTTIGFLFVGRGSAAQRLRDDARRRNLTNVVFHDEMHPDDIPGLKRHCHVGLLALDPRHKTHNIPCKFLTYMQRGLPALTSVNPGNDLVDLIQRERVGRAVTDASADTLAAAARELLIALAQDPGYLMRCTELSKRLFSADTAVRQIVRALEH